MKITDKCANLVCCIMFMALAGTCTALWGQTAGFAYVANCGDPCVGGGGPGNVSAYAIDGINGALVLVSGSPFRAGSIPRSVTGGPTGQFAYVANLSGNKFSAYHLAGASGA